MGNRKKATKPGKAVTVAVAVATEDTPANTTTNKQVVWKGAKKLGKVVAVVAAVATEDTSSNTTTTEQVVQKRTKKLRKTVTVVVAVASEDTPANASTTEQVVPSGEGGRKCKNEDEGILDSDAVPIVTKKKWKAKSKKNDKVVSADAAFATTTAAAAADNESMNNHNLPSATAGNTLNATDVNISKDGSDGFPNKKLPAKAGGISPTADVDANGDIPKDGNDVPTPTDEKVDSDVSLKKVDSDGDGNISKDGNDVSPPPTDNEADTDASPDLQANSDSLLYSDKFEDDPPFNFYHQYIPGNQWNKDPEDTNIIRPVEIFPVTGSCRKREVKDTFDWLLPSTIPANHDSSSEAYSTEFKFL
jgi:hypothetical protein